MHREFLFAEKTPVTTSFIYFSNISFVFYFPASCREILFVMESVLRILKNLILSVGIQWTIKIWFKKLERCWRYCFLSFLKHIYIAWLYYYFKTLWHNYTLSYILSVDIIFSVYNWARSLVLWKIFYYI